MHIPAILLTLLPLALASPVSLNKRQYIGSFEENQLIDGSPCRPVTILFARGTAELGNVGALAGPPFFQAVADRVGSQNVAVQGVDYDATVTGFLVRGSPIGTASLISLVQRAMTQCPQTKLVLSGYSQGAQVVHNAADLLTPQETAFVNSVVLFGDPFYGTAVGNVPSDKTLVICHPTDNICMGGVLILASHLDYSVNADQAAEFVVAGAQNS